MKNKILVVDDDPDVTKVLLTRLKGAGFDVDAASGGEEALVKVAQRPPDVIILDIMMPGVTGNEVAARLKLKKETKTIPIIFLSAYVAKEEDIIKGNQIPGVVIMSKPYDFDVLLSKIKAMIS